MNLNSENKRFLGISILLMGVGAFKLYSRGLYNSMGDLNWFNILVPFGMGVGALVFTLTKIYLSNKNIREE